MKVTRRADRTPYSILAAGYDVVMEHVDYEAWAAHVHGLLGEHAPEARDVLELGCGTGSLALELQPMGAFRYAATDRVPEMIRVARAKAEMYGVDVQFGVADFTDFRVDVPVDVALLLYDGVNYLLETDAIAAMLRCVHTALRSGGVFVMDQSTLANSVNNADYFGDEGEAEGFAYVRRSRFDAETRLHETTFDITVLGKTFHERHVQRAYEPSELRPLIEAAGFTVEAAYDGFTLDDAHDASERVHWVLAKR